MLLLSITCPVSVTVTTVTP